VKQLFDRLRQRAALLRFPPGTVHQMSSIKWPRGLALFCLGSGFVLRVVHYLHNRSLWLDEAMLARNIADRSALQLFYPLDYHQGAPVLFLLLVKGMTTVFGQGELALRLLPLLASLASLVLFYKLATMMLKPWTVPVAMFIMAICPPLVYYAQEFKQYSVDVAVLLALSWYTLRIWNSATWTRRQTATLTVLGCTALFLSHPAIFAISGISCALLVRSWLSREKLPLTTCAATIVPWIVCFGLNYWLFLRPLAANQHLTDYWAGGLIRLSLDLTTTLQSLRIPGKFLYFAGFSGIWKHLVLLLTAFAVARGFFRRSPSSLILGSYLAFAAAASLMGKFPVAGRVSLYLIPIFVLLALKGLDLLSGHRLKFAAPLIAAGFVVSMGVSARQLFTSRIEVEEVRPLLYYLQERCQPSDHVYVNSVVKHLVEYYWRDGDPTRPRMHIGQLVDVDEVARLHADIAMMRKYRLAWFLFAHDHKGIEDFFRSNMNGKILEEHHEVGASLFLFEFAEDGPTQVQPAQR
jgi:hypothetical protein